MTVRVNKPAINVREELADLRKPTGIAGEAMLRAETPQEQQALLGFGRRNVLINGDMKISQRGTSFTGVSHSTYTLDRWELNEDSSAEFTITKSSETPDGVGSSIKLDVTTADTHAGSADYVVLEQRIEGYNVQAFASGTSNAKPHTVSFWVRSNVTGTYVCELKYDTGGYEASQAYTIDAADTWEHKVLVFPPQTLSAPANDNSAELRVTFWLLAGSNYTGGGTLSTQWTTTENLRAVGQTNLVANTSNEIYFTGVQLEVGKVATPFEHRSYGEELALCQRYYNIATGMWMSGQSYGMNGSVDGLVMPFRFPVDMRISSPTIAFSGGNDGGSNATLHSGGTSTSHVNINLRSQAGDTYVWYTNFTITADAEM